MPTFDLQPACGRIFIKTVSILQKQAAYFQVSALRAPQFNDIYALRVACVDAADSSALSFQFERGFFANILNSGNGGVADTSAYFSTKLLVRCFKGVSPNKLSELKLQLSNESLEYTFVWKTGMVSSRVLASVVLPDNHPCVPSNIPSTVQPIEHIALSVSPQYLNGLLAHIPDSPTLWALTLTHRWDENVSSGPVVFVTNHTAGVQDASSVVGLTISQAELNRNGSYIRESAFPLDFSLKIPLSELRGIASLVADDVFRDEFSLGIGFSKYSNNRDMLTVHAMARSSAPHCGFTVKLWFKGSPVPDINLYEEDVKLEELDLDEIDPSRSVHSPTAGTPFIVHSATGTVVQTASQPS